jgi:hypothetical protein
MTTEMKYTTEQYMVGIELENYVAEAERPQFDRTAKLARQWLKAQGINSSNLLHFVTAVKSLEKLWDDEHITKKPAEFSK